MINNNNWIAHISHTSIPHTLKKDVYGRYHGADAGKPSTSLKTMLYNFHSSMSCLCQQYFQHGRCWQSNNYKNNEEEQDCDDNEEEEEESNLDTPRPTPACHPPTNIVTKQHSSKGSHAS